MVLSHLLQPLRLQTRRWRTSGKTLETVLKEQNSLVLVQHAFKELQILYSLLVIKRYKYQVQSFPLMSVVKHRRSLRQDQKVQNQDQKVQNQDTEMLFSS